jgi:hypothetical protein
MSDSINDQLAQTDSLSEARQWLRDNREKGVDCPCCDQFAKVYRRAMLGAIPLLLIRIYRENPTDYVNIPDLYKDVAGEDAVHERGTGLKAKYWGLIEPMPGDRLDGSNRNGWWRLTDAGRAFVRGQITVPKYVHTFNDECLERSGRQVSITDVLGNRFNYNDMMAGR